MARKATRSHPAGPALLMLVLSSCFVGRGVAQDAPSVGADQLRTGLATLIPANVAASAWNVLESGKVGAAAKALTAPNNAVALSGAAASALGLGIDVFGAAGDIGLALGGAGMAATAALQKKVDTIEKILQDCIKTNIAIQTALESVAGDVAVKVAMAPYRQGIAALNLIKECLVVLGGPNGLVGIVGRMLTGLASPVGGLPALIAQGVKLLGTVVANPAAAGAALAQATVGALVPLKAALAKAGNLLVGQARAVIAPLVKFCVQLVQGAVVAGGSLAAGVLHPGGIANMFTKLITDKVMALKPLLGLLG